VVRRQRGIEVMVPVNYMSPIVTLQENGRDFLVFLAFIDLNSHVLKPIDIIRIRDVGKGRQE
jgi:hypothetical protein